MKYHLFQRCLFHEPPVSMNQPNMASVREHIFQSHVQSDPFISKFIIWNIPISISSYNINTYYFDLPNFLELEIKNAYYLEPWSPTLTLLYNYVPLSRSQNLPQLSEAQMSNCPRYRQWNPDEVKNRDPLQHCLIQFHLSAGIKCKQASVPGVSR